MPTRTDQPVTVRAGETRPWQIQVLDEDGAEVDVSGEHLIFRIGKHLRTTAPHFLVDLDEDSDQITVEDSGSGSFSIVRYDPGIDDLKPAGKYFYELRVVQAGNDARVVVQSELTIEPSLTDD